MMRTRLGLLTLVMVMTAGCVARVNLVAEENRILRMDKEWARAASTSDVERILWFWADDAILMVPDEPALIGREAIREFVTAMRAIPGFEIYWETDQVTVGKGGKLAYATGRNRVRRLDENGEVLEIEGKFVTVWRKEGEIWKCAVDTWNASPVASGR